MRPASLRIRKLALWTLGYLQLHVGFATAQTFPSLCVPDPNARWLPGTSIRSYLHASVYDNLDWRFAILNALLDWDQALAAAPGKPSLDLSLERCIANCDEECDSTSTGNCIIFAVAHISSFRGSRGICASTKPQHFPNGIITWKEIEFNEAIAWNSGNRYGTALHEIGHALGMAHVDSFWCGLGEVLMDDAPANCAQNVSIDATAEYGIRCLYGDIEGTCTPKIGLAVAPNRYTREVDHYRGKCFCGLPKPAVEEQHTYELAISESGGPYSVYANLTEADWLNDRYTYTFDRPYRNAMVRLRVLDDAGEMIDQATSVAPVDILETPTDVADVRRPRFQFRAFPTPFLTTTQIEFMTTEGGPVEVSIHDIAGRRLVTLLKGSFLPGLHRVTFDPRLVAGEVEIPSGVYFYSIRSGRDQADGKVLFLRTVN